MDELVVFIREAIDRKQVNVRRQKRRDALRLQLVRIFQLIADRGTFGKRFAMKLLGNIFDDAELFCSLGLAVPMRRASSFIRSSWNSWTECGSVWNWTRIEIRRPGGRSALSSPSSSRTLSTVSHVILSFSSFPSTS